MRRYMQGKRSIVPVDAGGHVRHDNCFHEMDEAAEEIRERLRMLSAWRVSMLIRERKLIG